MKKEPGVPAAHPALPKKFGAAKSGTGLFSNFLFAAAGLDDQQSRQHQHDADGQA